VLRTGGPGLKLGWRPTPPFRIINPTRGRRGRSTPPRLFHCRRPPGNVNGKLGRLGKIGVVAARGNQLCYSGIRYPDAQDVFNQFLIDTPAMVLADWTHQAVGHWRGGTESFYWNIIFLANPNPAY
jgi:hypothetical protein